MSLMSAIVSYLGLRIRRQESFDHMRRGNGEAVASTCLPLPVIGGATSSERRRRPWFHRPPARGRALVRARRHGPWHPPTDADRHRHDAAVPVDEAEVPDHLDRALNVLTSSLGRLDVAE